MSGLATRALHVAIGVCIVGTGLGVGQQTQSAQQAAALTVEKIRGNLYIVKNGSCAGLVATLKAILNYQPSTDLFIPGHGNPVTRSDVEALIKSIEEKRAQIQELVRQGKSLDEVKTVFKVEDRPAQPGKPRFLSLAEAIYLELTEKK